MSHRVTSPHGACEISSLPGQSQVAVCHSFFVDEGHRKQGHGHVLKATQQHCLQGLHYDYALCTVAADNKAQLEILKQSGWQKLAEFRNRRSRETTELWGTVP